MAAALHTSTTLTVLYLNDNYSVDKERVDAAFIAAIRANPDIPAESSWCLYAYDQDDFSRLKALAAQSLAHTGQ